MNLCNFYRLLTESIKYMNEADLYEVTANLYKLVIPIHEKSHNYESLMKCYGDLRGIFT
jgi:hypothetical protein